MIVHEADLGAYSQLRAMTMRCESRFTSVCTGKSSAHLSGGVLHIAAVMGCTLHFQSMPQLRVEYSDLLPGSRP